MEILVAVLALAGTLLAAVTVGALATRLREEPEGWLIGWTVAAAGLALALPAITLGTALGFGTWTFKLYQLGGSLLAPLWMAVGLVQLLAERVPPRFVAWLGGIATTVVVAVVILFDPVSRVASMGRSLPAAADHWSPLFAGYALLAVHLLTALLLLGAVVLAVLRWRAGDEYDLDNLHATLVVAPSGLALLGALRLPVPGGFTAALLIVAAAGLWYCVLRPLAPYEEEETAVRGEREPRRARAEEPPAVTRPRHTSGLGELVAEYRANDTALGAAPPTAAYPPAGAPPRPTPAQGYGSAAHASAEYPASAHASAEYPAQEYGRHSAPRPRHAQTGPHQTQPGHGAAQGAGMPATGVMYPGAELHAHAHASAPAPSGRPSPGIFGMLTVFTLMDGHGDAFDRLAGEAVEAVRRNEPDTLIYVCHGVRSAPLQRIVYELYRDEVAYADHQRQPHVERFVAERQPMLLATNVIELNVNAAKVMPLPTALY